jgi:Tfp pilus assembly protein PilF
MFALLASWSEDIGNLTGPLLIVAVLAVIWCFRKELRAFIKSMSKVRLHGLGGELEMTAQHHPEAESRAGGQEEEPPLDDGDEAEDSAGPSAVISTASETETATSHEEDGGDETSENLDDLRRHLTKAIRSNDNAKATELFERLQKREDDARRRKDDLGYWLWARFVHNMQPDALEKLEKLAADDEIAAEARMYRGWSLTWASDATGAATDFALARDAARDERMRTDAIAYRAEALDVAGDYDQAVAELEAALREVHAPEPRARLWKGLADVYGKHNEHQLQALALQQALETTPSDTKLRFSAGWAYSNADDDLFAPATIHHYRAALRLDPSYEPARNNLGVAYQRSDMGILSVDAYRRANEDGNTLAAANLAYLYLNAGFADEAEATVAKAAQADFPHPNVAQATAAIATTREEQEERRTQLTAKGERQTVFLGRYAEARIRQGPRFEGTWSFHDGNQEVQVIGQADEIVGEWMARKTKWQFKGLVYGCAARLLMSEMEYSGWSAAREERGFSKRAEAFGYLSNDGGTLELMEVKDDTLTFRSLRRKKHQPEPAAA